MIAFVSLTRAKEHLYIIDNAEDSYLLALIGAASGAVQNYLKASLPWQPVLDSNLQPELDSNGVVYARDSNGAKLVRLEVEQATLLLLGYLYKNRDENPDGAFAIGYLPAPVTALLYPLRRPALA